ncbi:hypothetical protein [Comamonas sp. lk]|uniref:hypothetical protein n=1 Tax=Comamonas sp. lk TaxID=2201272 RepID=UPI000EB251FA|nr:hypothetical protein [Comamonas sp. lk]
MDAVLSFVGSIFKQVAFELLFFWPGWLALKVLTLGKFPKLTKPGRDINDYGDVQAVSYFGVLVVLLALVAIVKYWPK